MLPVLNVMKDYDRVLADGKTRPFVVSDFFFESGEPLPHVNVGLKEMKDKAKKAMADAKEAYKEGKEEAEEEASAQMTITIKY